MKVSEVIPTAKAFLIETFADEKIINLGLEEVELDESEGVWNITFGFSRPWDRKIPGSVYEAMDKIYGRTEKPIHRDYRVVRVRDSDGKVLSIKLHDLAAA